MAEEAETKPKKTLEITVNNKPVVIPDKKITGYEIKQAAIEQGVSIELDFQLALILPKGRQIIGDSDELVITHKKDNFIATAADDNS
ncbi:multiubiquitin domain-containing protein [Arthrobacter sp. STN4]|uniref:multiubiquitin domain-containing protein n=1 Tax=Arthrobacter sp. STN4 TaxID=2923276 RepID=UPI002119E25D|nr:multiubiquitin domain-containing protein [Arthrobacter sp. STN4]MCQ9163108.1 multiubiquitin domain-containing protein [Arthrobacter sp. STN4]